MNSRLAAAGAAVLLAVTLVSTGQPAQAAEETFPPECPWMDTALSAELRARLLLDHSTLDQKIRWLDEQSANNPTQTVFNIGGGLTTTMPAQVPCTPVIQYTDGPASVAGAGGVTVFPAPVALSATWNESLAREKGKAQAFEASVKYSSAPARSTGGSPIPGL